MILCNSSDRIARQQKTEQRRQFIRKIIDIITMPLNIRITITPARSGAKEKRHWITR